MKDKVKAFGDLHIPGKPLILYNIWDAGSAKVVAEAGAKAIATGSWGVACAHGYKDGETFPIEMVLTNLAQILRVTDLPVTLDFEAGYGTGPAEVEVSVARAADAGATGINLEDKDPFTRALFPAGEAAARGLADGVGFVRGGGRFGGEELAGGLSGGGRGPGWERETRREPGGGHSGVFRGLPLSGFTPYNRPRAPGNRGTSAK